MATDAFLNKIKINEGSKDYQRKMKSYLNDRFRVYKDSLGYPTIGYGHLCNPSEVQKYKNGITEPEAHNLLCLDVAHAEQQARSLFQMNKFPLPVQEVLVEMVFQLGASKAQQFKKFKANLDTFNYKAAANELKNSNWFKQTPNRVLRHIAVLESL